MSDFWIIGSRFILSSSLDQMMLKPEREINAQLIKIYT